MKVERARPCPTHTHTHAQTHTRWWGPRGLPGQVAGPWEWSWTQSPLCAGAPTGLSAVTVTTTQTSLRGASSPSNQAQARPAGPAPGCSHPTPLGCSGRPGSVCTSLLPSDGGCCLPAPAQAPSPVGWDQSPKQLLLQPGLLVWKWAHLLPRGPVGQIDPSSHGRLGHPAD